MNAPLRTRAGEGFDRLGFTVAQVHAMVKAGIMDSDAPVELWEGEFVPMNAKHNRHEIWKNRLMRILSRALPDEIALTIESSLYLSDITFVEPDLLMYADTILPEDVRGPDCLLVVEVADSSVARDLNAKVRLYSKHGVQHYWVLDAERRRAHIHSDPQDGTYQSIRMIESDGALVLPFEPALSIKLADLK